MAQYLDVYAGAKALQHLKEKGLKAEDINILACAAGGPKWLVLNGLDKYLFTSFFKKRKRPLSLVGSSIGSWRFAAASRKKAGETIDLLEEAYIRQRYGKNPSLQEVAGQYDMIYDSYLSGNAAEEILSHPLFRLNVFATRCRGLAASDRKVPLMAGLSAAYVTNLISRKGLGLFFERTHFYDPRETPPFSGMDEFPLQQVPLTAANLRSALMASGSLPLIMLGITGIKGAKAGTYRDGGLLDYHLDLPFAPGDGLVLYPHYSDRIIPGWLDKQLKGRKPGRRNMDSVVMVCPSREFIDLLPGKRIPDRDDFKTFLGRDEERMRLWRSIVGESGRLSDEFHELVRGQRFAERARPLPCS